MTKPTRNTSPRDYKNRAVICKALGHPVRLYIVDRLAAGERCVCELREEIGLDISTVSRHLAALKNAGLISDEKRGKQVFYRLAAPCVTGFFECLEAVQRNRRQG